MSFAKWVAVGLLATAMTAEAADVKLISNQSGFVLTGELIRFDGQDYVIRSSIGQLTVDGYSVRCEGEGCPKTTIFQTAFGVYGSNTIGATLMPGLIESYSETQDALVERVIGSDATQLILRLKREASGEELAEINLMASGSAAAFPGLISGDATIGMSSRPVNDLEFAALENAGIREITRAGTEHVLALDGLVVVVSQQNPLSKIAVEDLVSVFSGEISNWQDLGGPDAPINIYLRKPGAGSYTTLTSQLLDPAGEVVSPSAITVNSARLLSDAVAADPFGIGVTGAAFERNARALAIETSCGLVVEPSEFNVKTEEYPLARRLFLYTTGAPLPPSAKGILEYALSDDAQDLIADLGFVDQSISSVSLNRQGRRIADAFITPLEPEALRVLRELALELLDASRLSVTMRFRPNSSVLDVKSREDLGRLARFISSGELNGKEIALIGFADDSNRFEANIALSEQRARQIQAELDAELERLGNVSDVDLVVLGYGDLAPVGCGDEALGGVSNRRVEVWVRDRI